MFGMNLTPSQEQLMGQLRQILPVLGTLAVSFGLLKTEDVGNVIAIILNVTGAGMVIGSMAWSAYSNTRASMVAKVDAIAKEPSSPVVAVITTNTIEGRKLANSMPGTTTVPAGTLEAAKAARDSA